MRLDWDQLAGLRVTIMGLGLHGGGVAAAAFFAAHGARVTVTDLRDQTALSASIEKLSAYPIRYVLGRHETSDFSAADLVVKNPAVPVDSPFLGSARNLESDISIFLSLVANPLIAVTGTKGKSTTASAIYHVLKSIDPAVKIGGNITVSPLSFVDELREVGPKATVVLELSSWQLGDLRNKGLLKPQTAVITNIFPDHLNRYADMDAYVADKAVIVEGQSTEDFTVCNYDDVRSSHFVAATAARVRYFSRHPLPAQVEGAWFEDHSPAGFVRSGTMVEELVGEPLLVPGSHNRMNLLAAGLALHCSGLPAETIRHSLSRFRGLPHRLQFVTEIDGRRYYNDSAATIPEATVAAVGSFPEEVVLIAGGTDKVLDFAPFLGFAKRPKWVVLLAGSADAKIVPMLKAAGIPCSGPFDSIDRALRSATEISDRGDVVLLSPGCTSFEMFANEFDRGDSYVRAVRQLQAVGRG